MRCHHVRAWLASGAGDSIDNSKSRAVKRHAAKCSSCAHEMRLWKEAGELLRLVLGDKVPQPPHNIAEAVMKRINKQSTPVYSGNDTFHERFDKLDETQFFLLC